MPSEDATEHRDLQEQQEGATMSKSAPSEPNTMTVAAPEDVFTLENETVTPISSGNKDLDASSVVEESMLTTSETDRIVRPASETSTTTNQALTCKASRISTMTDTSKIIREIEQGRKERRQRELAEFKEISTAPPQVADEIDSKFDELQEKIEDESAVGNIIYELSEYAFSPENNTIIAASGDLEALDGGIDLLFDCIQRYPSNVTVVAYGMRALGSLAYNAENRRTIVKKGGIEVAVEAMTNFPNQERVQQKGCGAFGNFAYGNDRNKIAIARQGGIELVAKAMAKFHNQEQVQQYGCAAFGNLAGGNDDNIRMDIVKHGGIELVARAMTNFTNQEQVQQWGCFAFGNLAYGNEENIMAIARQGGIGLVAKAMAKFPNQEQVQQDGCVAFGNLASGNDDNRMAVSRQGGIELVAKAMTKFPNHEKIQHNGCFAFAKLSNNDSRSTTLIAGEIMELVVHAMTKFPNHEDIQVCCCHVVANIAWDDEEGSRKAGELGGVVDAIGAAMEQFPNSENVLSTAGFALEALGSSSVKHKKGHNWPWWCGARSSCVDSYVV